MGENSRIDYFFVVIEDTLSTSMLHVIGSCLDQWNKILIEQAASTKRRGVILNARVTLLTVDDV